MATINEDREWVEDLPEGDVIRELLEQHLRIKEMFVEVRTSKPPERAAAFDQLCAVIAAHETAEELAIRPTIQRILENDEEPNARNAEEAHASRLLSKISEMDVDSTDFLIAIAELEREMLAHNYLEEEIEFDALDLGCDQSQRQFLGAAVGAAMSAVPPNFNGSVREVIEHAQDSVRAMLD